MEIKFRRKKIDNFLVELEKFITANKLEKNDSMDLYMFLEIANKNKGNINIPNSLGRDKSIIELPKLVSRLNRYRAVSNIKNKITGKVYGRPPTKKTTGITSKYIRRLCYAINWIEVPEVDYETFFKKAMTISNFTNIEIDSIKKDGLLFKEFPILLVPEELYLNNDLYIFK